MKPKLTLPKLFPGLSRILVTGASWLKALGNNPFERLDFYRWRCTQEQLDYVLDVIGEAIVILDARMQVAQVNLETCKISGYSREEILGHQITDFLTPESAQLYGDQMPQILGKRIEMEGLKKEGNSFPVEVRITEARLDQEDCYILAIRDITERKLAEKALRESEERLRQLAENMEDAVWMATPDQSQMLYMSPAYEEIWGQSRENIYNAPRSFLEMIHPEDRERVSLRQADKIKGGYGEEYRVIRPDGTLRWVWSRAFPIHNERGEVYRIAGISEDITERKLAEEALRKSEAKNRALLEAIPDLMFRLDKAGVFLDYKANSDCQLFIPPEIFMGKKVLEVMPPEFAQQTMRYITQALATGEIQIYEDKLVIGDKIHDYEARLVALGEGEVLIMYRDITERKKVERLKNEFVSTVSHELRTPLTAIRGSLGLVLGGVAGPIPPQVQSMLDIAYKNCERLILLINDILDIEKIESGKLVFNPKVVEMMPLVQQALEVNRAYAEQYGVTFSLDQSLSEARVKADPDRLMQVFANLLSNAAKFSPTGETVSIAVARREQTIRVSVTDHGNGIPADFQERIFQKFAQADSSNTRQKGGTGLGLSISKTIIEKMGGQIGFETTPGKGTTFFFDLAEWQDENLALAELRSPARQRVLVCEDDHDIADLINILLDDEGFSCDLAYNAAEARQFLEQQTYAAMTLDLMMPGVDGISFLKELRQQPRTENLPVVVISAWADNKHQQRELNGTNLNVLDRITKPIDQERLLAAINRATNRLIRSRPHVLHIEDDPDLLELTSVILQDTATFSRAGSLQEARRQLQEQRFDLVILDMDLPDGRGSELLPVLNQSGINTPVIIFSVEEVGPEIARHVAAILIKSRTTNQELFDTIQAVIGRAKTGSSKKLSSKF
jgi:PAS domain S-box-containing protein